MTTPSDDDDKPASGLNGSGVNGTEPGSKVVRFPTLAERDRLRKMEEKLERKQSLRGPSPWFKVPGATVIRPTGQAEPFFKFGNIPPFTKYFMALIFLMNVPLLLWPDSSLIPFIAYTFGFVPGVFTGIVKDMPPWSYLSPFTHVFIHATWLHLIINTVMGTALCTFFERIFGARSTLIFCVICGLAGALVTMALNPFSIVPVVGASGCISGLFGAVILLMNEGRRTGSMPGRSPWPLVAFWVIFMIGTGMMTANLAWQAHIGGFIAGIGLTLARQKGKKLF